MEKAGQEVERLLAEIGEASLDPERVGELAELGAKLKAAQQVQESLEEEWLEAAAALE